MTNVDQQEINKFSELASRWWDPEGEFKPLHLINPLRLDFINQHSEGLFSSGRMSINKKSMRSLLALHAGGTEMADLGHSTL